MMGSRQMVVSLCDQLAFAGRDLSIVIFTFSTKVETAAGTISSLAHDSSFLSAVFQDIAKVVAWTSSSKSTIYNPKALEKIECLAKQCLDAFRELQKRIANATKQIRGRIRLSAGSIPRSEIGEDSCLLTDLQLDNIRTDLSEAKGTLMLLYHLGNLAFDLRGGSGQHLASSPGAWITKPLGCYLVKAPVRQDTFEAILALHIARCSNPSPKTSPKQIAAASRCANPASPVSTSNDDFELIDIPSTLSASPALVEKDFIHGTVPRTLSDRTLSALVNSSANKVRLSTDAKEAAEKSPKRKNDDLPQRETRTNKAGGLRKQDSASPPETPVSQVNHLLLHNENKGNLPCSAAQAPARVNPSQDRQLLLGQKSKQQLEMPQHGELPSNQGIQATQALADPLSKNDPGQPSMRVPGTEHTLEESTMHRMLLEKEHKEQLLAKARREQESKEAFAAFSKVSSNSDAKQQELERFEDEMNQNAAYIRQKLTLSQSRLPRLTSGSSRSGSSGGLELLTPVPLRADRTVEPTKLKDKPSMPTALDILADLAGGQYRQRMSKTGESPKKKHADGRQAQWGLPKVSQTRVEGRPIDIWTRKLNDAAEARAQRARGILPTPVRRRQHDCWNVGFGIPAKKDELGRADDEEDESVTAQDGSEDEEQELDEEQIAGIRVVEGLLREYTTLYGDSVP